MEILLSSQATPAAHSKRPNRTAKARRDQHTRAHARACSALLKMQNALSHRGCQPSKAFLQAADQFRGTAHGQPAATSEPPPGLNPQAPVFEPFLRLPELVPTTFSPFGESRGPALSIATEEILEKLQVLETLLASIVQRDESASASITQLPSGANSTSRHTSQPQEQALASASGNISDETISSIQNMGLREYRFLPLDPDDIQSTISLGEGCSPPRGPMAARSPKGLSH